MSNRNYTIIYNGRFYETKSLIDMRSDVSDDEWDDIVSQSIDGYCYFCGLNKVYLSEGGLDKDDNRLMRQLRRTIHTIRKIDPIIINKYDIDTLLMKYYEMAQEHIEAFTKPVNISNDESVDHADIYTNRLKISSL